MIVELLNTGSELLIGQSLNTHVRYIGQRLTGCGLRLARQTTVPDGAEIRLALSEALSRADVVIVTGGLGPTSDDITRDVAAELLGLELRHDPEIYARILERFARRGLVPPKTVASQAMVPNGAEVLANDHGTAPGLYLQDRSRPTSPRHVFLLPGPPRELHPMFERVVLPRLQAFAGSPLTIRILRTIGIPESHLQERVEALLKVRCPDVEIGYCARPGEVDLRLISNSPGPVSLASALVAAALGDAIYATGEENLEDVVVRVATQAGLSIATAESCTGGHVADRITSVPGASAVFLGACVVYANQEKTRQLGVPKDLIDHHGAVSPEVAAAMASGCHERTGADHVVALTGVAGPGPGTPEKPAGLCYIAHRSIHGDDVTRHVFPPDRPAFKEAATQAALDILRHRLILPSGIKENLH